MRPCLPCRDKGVVLQLQPRGSRPAFIQKIESWIREVNVNSIDGIWEDKARLMGALRPTRQQPLPITHDLYTSIDIPFTLAELKRVYGQNPPSTDTEATWVVYTDGSVIQQDGRAKGTFAGTFTQGPAIPTDFRGQALELPLSSTRMEAMAIIAEIAITPPSTPLDIHTDSLSAVHMM